jgi:hypothetical protein
MDPGDELGLRADVAAEAHLTAMLQLVYAGAPDRFTDDQIGALRETYKLGWITGFRASLEEVAEQLKGLTHDG